MKIKKIENMKLIENFFIDWNETMILSCLQGYMGTAWADDDINPSSCKIIIGDFCFLSGIPNKELLIHKPSSHNSDFIIMIPQNEEWSRLIEDSYGKNAKRYCRYAIKKEKDIFDINKLKEIIDNLNQDFELKMIDEDIYNKVLKDEWSKDLCSQFVDYEDYNKRGLGAVILHKGNVVSGASSYTVYKDGIEIEIDTKKEYRRKGLASICGAKLIIECLNKGLYPSWDAQNMESVKLSEKLGYHFDKEYTAYEISKY